MQEEVVMSVTVEQQLKGLGGALTDLRSYAEALASSVCDLWRAAMDTEEQKLGMHETYRRQDGRRLEGCKWVNIILRDVKGSIVELKARSGAKGCS
jgi:hypothetical protein